MDKEILRDYELDIIVKAWRDEKFRKNLLKNPKKAIEDEFGVHVPEDMEIFVHEERDNSLHLIVPSLPSNFSSESLTDDELRDVIGGVLAVGHLGRLSNKKDRERLKDLQNENEGLKTSIDQLKRELASVDKKSPKSEK